MPKMTRWTDAKIVKEIVFAETFAEPGAEAAGWLAALRSEAARRGLA